MYFTDSILNLRHLALYRRMEMDTNLFEERGESLSYIKKTEFILWMILVVVTIISFIAGFYSTSFYLKVCIYFWTVVYVVMWKLRWVKLRYLIPFGIVVYILYVMYSDSVAICMINGGKAILYLSFNILSRLGIWR